MRLGLQIPTFDWAGGPPRTASKLAEIAHAADAAGFRSIAVGDHLWQHPRVGGPAADMLEAYATLSYLSAHTTNTALMTVVTNPALRPPALLAKSVTTLDVLSGGRAWLGIGAGGWAEDLEALGTHNPPLRQRYELLEETLQYCLAMWQGEQGSETSFAGSHIQAERLLNVPQSLSRPHPPILIGGDGEKRTLPLVARYADACSLRPVPELSHKLELLQQYCEAEGRDYETIEKTCVFLFDVGEHGEKTEQLLQGLRRLADSGIETVYGRVEHLQSITPLEIIGRDVIPAIAGL